MDPLAKIATALDRRERRDSLEATQEECLELLKSRSGVLLTKKWKRQHFVSNDKPMDLRPSYVVSGTGISQYFSAEEEANEFFLETAQEHGCQRRREWWPSVFVAAVILALVQQTAQSVHELIRLIGGQ